VIFVKANKEEPKIVNSNKGFNGISERLDRHEEDDEKEADGPNSEIDSNRSITVVSPNQGNMTAIKENFDSNPDLHYEHPARIGEQSTA